MRTRSLLAGHPDIGDSLWGLVLLSEMKGCNAEALTLFEASHVISLATHGPEHEETCDAADKINKLGDVIGGGSSDANSDGGRGDGDGGSDADVDSNSGSGTGDSLPGDEDGGGHD